MTTKEERSGSAGRVAMVVVTAAFVMFASWVLLTSGPGAPMHPGMAGGLGLAWLMLMAAATITVVVISAVLVFAALAMDGLGYPSDAFRATARI